MNNMANVDGNGHSNCTTTTCDCRTRTVNLGLEMGRTYEIAVFGADRHPTESNYQLTLSGFSTQKSNCMPRCGDGQADRRGGVRLRRRDRPHVDGCAVRRMKNDDGVVRRLHDDVQVRSVLRRRRARHGQRARSATSAAA